MYYTYMKSPVGRLLVAGDESGLSRIGFPEGKGAVLPERGWQEEPASLHEAVEQLRAYFAGERKSFDLPMRIEGTPFQKKVWKALQAIPYGETISYGELARRVGAPKASRAVGSANGCNRIPIVIPCHRVIASDGTLGGFGGGLPTKQILLDLERSVVAR